MSVLVTQPTLLFQMQSNRACLIHLLSHQTLQKQYPPLGVTVVVSDCVSGTSFVMLNDVDSVSFCVAV